MKDYEKFSPEMIKMLAEYGLIPQLQELNNKEMIEADKLRETPIPKAESVGYNRFGTVFRQPTVLEGLDAGLKLFSGSMKDEQAKAAAYANILRQRDTTSQAMQMIQDAELARDRESADRAAYDAIGKNQMEAPMKDFNEQGNALNEFMNRNFDPMNPDFEVGGGRGGGASAPKLPPTPGYSLQGGGAPPIGGGRGNIIPPLAGQPQPTPDNDQTNPAAAFSLPPRRLPNVPIPTWRGWYPDGNPRY